MNEVRNVYFNCIADNTAGVVDGSDDVSFVVQTIVSSCEFTLRKEIATLSQTGLSTASQQGYTDGLRFRAKNSLSKAILRYKSQKLDGETFEQYANRER